jgi:hypothetical protein
MLGTSAEGCKHWFVTLFLWALFALAASAVSVFKTAPSNAYSDITLLYHIPPSQPKGWLPMQQTHSIKSTTNSTIFRHHCEIQSYNEIKAVVATGLSNLRNLTWASLNNKKYSRELEDPDVLFVRELGPRLPWPARYVVARETEEHDKTA